MTKKQKRIIIMMIELLHEKGLSNRDIIIELSNLSTDEYDSPNSIASYLIDTLEVM